VRRKGALTTDVERGEFVDSRVTFLDYAPDWIGTYKGRTKRGVQPETIAGYRRELGLDGDGQPLLDEDGLPIGAVGFFGRFRLGHVRPPDVKRYVAALEARGLAPNTVRLAIAPVRALFATAFEDGLIRANPVAGVRVVVQGPEDEDEEEVKALTEEQLAAFLAVLKADPDGKGWGEWLLFFTFLAETALRIGEAIEVRWADVEGAWLRVNQRYYRGRVGPPKGRKKRSVPLSRELAQALWTLRKETHAKDDELVFTSHNGLRIDQSNLMSRVLKPAARKAASATGRASMRSGTRARPGCSGTAGTLCRYRSSSATPIRASRSGSTCTSSPTTCPSRPLPAGCQRR
jgi:integrase